MFKGKSLGRSALCKRTKVPLSPETGGIIGETIQEQTEQVLRILGPWKEPGQTSTTWWKPLFLKVIWMTLYLLAIGSYKVLYPGVSVVCCWSSACHVMWRLKWSYLRKSRPNNHSKTKRQSGKQETVGHSVLLQEEKMTEGKIQLVMVTGMSSAGKTVAINRLRVWVAPSIICHRRSCWNLLSSCATVR